MKQGLIVRPPNGLTPATQLANLIEIGMSLGVKEDYGFGGATRMPQVKNGEVRTDDPLVAAVVGRTGNLREGLAAYKGCLHSTSYYSSVSVYLCITPAQAVTVASRGSISSSLEDHH